MNNILPRADPTRETAAHDLFPYKDMSAEEYAARNGHAWFMFAYDAYSYENQELERWIQRLGQLLRSYDELRKCRENCLTSEERLQIEEEILRIEQEGI